MLTIGLTGSIAMGKSTTAQILRANGIPIFDSDQTVHDIYKSAKNEEIRKAFPGVVKDGVVDRQELAQRVIGDPASLKTLERVIHPIVESERLGFIQKHQSDRFIVLDIPLLFEVGAERVCDVTLVVSASQDVQKYRVLQRPNMDEEKFKQFLSRQLPDEQKKIRSHCVIKTDRGLAFAGLQANSFIRALSSIQHTKRRNISQ